MEKKRKNKITPEKMQIFNNSRIAKDAVKFLGDFSENTHKQIQQSEYTVIGISEYQICKFKI